MQNYVKLNSQERQSRYFSKDFKQKRFVKLNVIFQAQLRYAVNIKQVEQQYIYGYKNFVTNQCKMINY